MTAHWVVIVVSPHGTQPVSHDDEIVLKTYFDEDPDDDSDLSKNEDQFTVASEHSITQPSAANLRLWHPISPTEYAAAAYSFYLWAEPYAIAAYAKPGYIDGLALGRLKLTKRQETFRGDASGAGIPLYEGVDPEDKVIKFEVQLTNSVVQFIVDEMNTNGAASDILARRSEIGTAQTAVRNERADPSPEPFLPWSDTELENRQEEMADAIDAAERTLGHRTHSNEGVGGFLQDIYFLGGGEWDHKPIIRPVWGTNNRLGNRHEFYYYDGWSNIHFGYIAARMRLPLANALDGAGQAQEVDNAGPQDGDDPADAQAIRAGYNLGLRRAPGDVTRADVLNILLMNPGWVGRS